MSPSATRVGDDAPRAHALGRVMLSPADIEFSPRRLVQPDVFVVPQPEASTVRSWRDVRRLLLAVEVLSPATAHADRHRKRLLYQGQGVPEYWIIDPEARLVERWKPEDARPEILVDSIAWQPNPDVAPLRLDLPVLFQEAIGPR